LAAAVGGTAISMSQPAQQQSVPGHQTRMDPAPDCGEDSYVGHGRLEGKATSSPAETAVSAGPWPSSSPGKGRTC
jgi:hypothetical protein